MGLYPSNNTIPGCSSELWIRERASPTKTEVKYSWRVGKLVKNNMYCHLGLYMKFNEYAELWCFCML